MSWLDRAACRDHPVLAPDAWTSFSKNRPDMSGLRAMIVCRVSCPVMKECRSTFLKAPVGTLVQTVAGGGWFDKAGEPREMDLDRFDVHLASAYIGVDPMWVQRRMGAGNGFTTVHVEQGRAYFTAANVRYMARKQGLQCGSHMAEDLHVLKGEWPCQVCLSVQRRNALLAA